MTARRHLQTAALIRIALVVLAAQGLLVGVWALVFPRSFYDDFPGMGRVWVAVDGPYNEHLVRDVGGLNLGLAFVAGLALVTGSVLVARAAGGAALVFGVPHLLYHATHLDVFETADAVGTIVALVIAVLAAAAALAAPAQTSRPPRPSASVRTPTSDQPSEPDRTPTSDLASEPDQPSASDRTSGPGR